jgi:hypothetical protein
VRVHVRDPGAAAAAKRFGLEWTPAILVLDPDGVERHRIEGFLPPKEFAAQLLLGLGHAARLAQDWKGAERRFEEVLEKYSDTEAAPEALYWRGVVRYKAGDAGALTATGEEFTRRYAASNWAKKSSVWLKAS